MRGIKVEKYNLKRVNKVNLIIVLSISLLLSVQSFATGDISYGKQILLCTGAASIITIIAYFVKFNGTAKGIIMCGTPFIAGYVTSFLRGDVSSFYVTYLATGCLCALYFNRKILISHGILINIFLVGGGILFPERTYGVIGFKEFSTKYVALNCSLMILYFLIKWGSQFIQSALEEGVKSSSYSDKLEATMMNIDNSAKELNSSIVSLNNNIIEVSETSNLITEAVEEITKGVEEEAHSISTIANIISDASTTIENAQRLSEEVEAISSNANQLVDTSATDIDIISDQMKTIDKSVKAAVSTVSDLYGAMESINDFLGGIEAISKQTNLLALNANIEAARAGEAGKGFGVVANEVRKLADQSKSITEDIHKIIDSLKIKTSNALNEVQQGDMAVEQGQATAVSVKNNFVRLSESFKTIDENISSESKLIDNMVKTFIQVRENIESISAISEEHAATTEHILSSIAEQNDKVIEIASSIDGITKLSGNLENMTNGK